MKITVVLGQIAMGNFIVSIILVGKNFLIVSLGTAEPFTYFLKPFVFLRKCFGLQKF